MKSITTLVALLIITIVFVQAGDESHIEANVPPPAAFTAFLHRDVAAYLTNRVGQKVTVEHDLLREAPTQSGVAYPKFYIWVRGFSPDKTVVAEGAMRLAAIEKKRFDVTDFVTKEQIITEPTQIESVFPQALISKIREKAGIK